MSDSPEYYRVFPVDLASKLNNKQAMTFLHLLFKADFVTGESNVLLETLSKLSGYDSETVSSHLHKVADESGYLIIERKYIGNDSGKPKTKNIYKVKYPTMNFIMVDKEFLNFEIDGLSDKAQHELKGFILLVKCVCLNNTNITKYSLRQIAERIGLSYSTIQNNMNKCITLGYIVQENGYYRIALPYFDKGNDKQFPMGTPDLYKDIYRAISNYCIMKNCTIPPYNKNLISKIAVKYTYMESELTELGDKAIAEQYSITRQLESRLPNPPDKIDSLNYFVKVLTNDVARIKDNTPQTYIM